MQKIVIDKSLPLDLVTQIEGAIEYGIMLGYYQDDPKLPSAKTLGKQLDVGYVTVVKAYQSLKQRGLIDSQAGSGTVVKIPHNSLQTYRKAREIKDRFIDLMIDMEKLGIDQRFFVPMLINPSTSLLSVKSTASLRVLFVGNSVRINSQYIQHITAQLSGDIQFDNLNFQQWETLSEQAILQYDAILTIPHCVSLITHRVGKTLPVLATYLTPSPEAKQQLEKLDPNWQIGVVSRFAAFLPVMLSDIKEHAKFEGNLHSLVLGQQNLQEWANEMDIIIYSTGCNAAILQLCDAPFGFEYDHIPEPYYLKTHLIPALNTLQQNKPKPNH